VTARTALGKLPMAATAVEQQPADLKSMWSADTLPETKMSQFIQKMVRGLLCSLGEGKIAETVCIRVVSNLSKSFRIHKLVRDHFTLTGK